MHGLLPSLRFNDWTRCLNTLLRSLNISKGFNTSLDSVNYFRTEEIPVTIPGIVDAAVFLTEAGFDLTFGRWNPCNSTIYGKRDPPVEDKKRQYDTATGQWTDTEITMTFIIIIIYFFISLGKVLGTYRGGG